MDNLIEIFLTIKLSLQMLIIKFHTQVLSILLYNSWVFFYKQAFIKNNTFNRCCFLLLFKWWWISICDLKNNLILIFVRFKSIKNNMSLEILLLDALCISYDQRIRISIDLQRHKEIPNVCGNAILITTYKGFIR